MEAAFFDVDKTVIAKASIMAFARDFRREGLVTRRSMAKGAWSHVVFVRWGASANKLDRIRRSVLDVTRGWDQAHVRDVVTSGLVTVIDPITFAEARNLIDEHLGQGRRVYLVSAAPTEIVEPLAEHLGVHGAVASIARLDGEGRYTGELERYASGSVKAEAIRQLAEGEGVDLAGSYAYSDSATDLPMLEAVGHPIAVNPDRELRRVAEERGWEIRRFGKPGGSAAAESSRWHPVATATVAAVAAAGGAGAVAWRARSQPGRA